MKMKNVLMILVTLAMVFAMAGAVSGDGKTITYSSESGTTKLNYTVSDNYEVVIPSDVSFQQNLYNVQEVNVTKALIGPGTYLHVMLTSGNYTADGGFKLVNDGSSIPYNITNKSSGDEIRENGKTILTVASGKLHPKMGVITPLRGEGIGGFMELNFSTTNNYIGLANKSGNHIDTLTFTLFVNQNAQ